MLEVFFNVLFTLINEYVCVCVELNKSGERLQKVNRISNVVEEEKIAVKIYRKKNITSFLVRINFYI